MLPHGQSVLFPTHPSYFTLVCLNETGYLVQTSYFNSRIHHNRTFSNFSLLASICQIYQLCEKSGRDVAEDQCTRIPCERPTGLSIGTQTNRCLLTSGEVPSYMYLLG